MLSGRLLSTWIKMPVLMGRMVILHVNSLTIFNDLVLVMMMMLVIICFFCMLFILLDSSIINCIKIYVTC